MDGMGLHLDYLPTSPIYEPSGILGAPDPRAKHLYERDLTMPGVEVKEAVGSLSGSLRVLDMLPATTTN